MVYYRLVFYGKDAGGMELFTLDAADVTGADIEMLKARFPKRSARAAGMARRGDALACLAAGVLLRRVLGVESESEIAFAPGGRPYIEGGPGFSLSHSGGRCMLAVGPGRVGADIEKLDEAGLIAAPAALTKAELEWIGPCPLERFHLLWTRKESIFKAVGGFADPAEICVLDGAIPRGLTVLSMLWQGFALSACSDREFELKEPVNIKGI